MAGQNGSHSPRTITEVKLRLRGEPKQFEVELLLREGTLTLVRFVTQTAMKGDENRFAAGSYTYGYFWDDRSYNIYRMHLASGELYGHRFDILRDAQLEGDRLLWTDLLLDVWLYADGRIVWKDEDELAEYLREGWMSREDGELVRRTRRELERSFDHIVAEADELLGRVPAGLLATG
jgi:predicted RNA-binding protein associated with RNAse of E/G family